MNKSFTKYSNFFYCVFIIILIILIYKNKNIDPISINRSFINLCKQKINLHIHRNKKIENPFLTICIPVYNMEKYLYVSILSILNQSFRNYEILILNDHSNDNSERIITKIQSENNEIRLINHEKNLGIYKSRIDLIINAKGDYIIFLDSDDLFSNKNLLKLLYENQIVYNLDIIEYSNIIQIEKVNLIYYSRDPKSNHFHDYGKKIIFQKELSNILFYYQNNYSEVNCRCLWNKMVRKAILEKTINYLNDKVKDKEQFNFAEDTIINIINFEFASNYSNLNLYGYMYNIRRESMSHKKEMDIKNSQNIVFFYQLFYQYIKDFNKNINYLFYDLKKFDYYFEYLKFSNSSDASKIKILNLYNDILKENNNISNEIKNYVLGFLRKYNT